MADVKISMMLEDGGSINKKTNETKALNGELTKSQKLARGLSDAPGMTSQQAMDYGRTRATIGTGAEARDFAKQSEGLSGLVRLYAIYAANIYAAGAAFTALREAANTETMIKGMDQLGARSGIALGTLAKNFADATGGAISLRESAEATTKAISSGLSQKQFTQLGEVALKASQALGINMSDAVSRLTRGITKLEPELLDELGIFAKIGPATEKYANELGKPVAALTDFERRQAFANAVLEEGISKFGKLDLPTNPYDKLSASLKNLSQSALELVNKALLPLINALSQSPTTLAGALGILGVGLIKQALPAIGQYREELKKTATLASEVAAKKALESREARLSAFGGALQKADDLASKAEDRASATWSKVEKLVKESSSRVAESVKPALAKLISKDNILDVTEKDLKLLDDLGRKNTKIAATYKELAADIRVAQEAARGYFQAQKAKEEAGAKPLPFFSMAGFNQRIAEAAASRAARSAIVSAAVEEASTGGIVSSFKQLGKETTASKELGTVGKAMTLVSGTAGILTTGIVRLASSLGTLGMVVGVGVAAFTLLDSWLTKTGEKTEKFNKAIDNSTVAVKTYGDAVKIIREEGDPFKTEALMAASTAVSNLRDSFKGTVDAYLELQKSIDLSWWDTFKDKVAFVFDSSAVDKFAETQVASLNKVIAAAARYGKEQELIQKVNEALGTRSQGAWLSKIITDGPKAATAIKNIYPELEKIVNVYGNAAAESKKFDDSLKEALGSQKKLTTSLADNTPAGKYASDLLQFAVDFKTSMADSSTAVRRLNSLLNDQANLGIFSPEAAKGLMQLTAEVTKLNTANTATANDIENTYANIQKLEAERRAASKDGNKELVSSLDKQISTQQQLLQNLRKSQGLLSDQVSKLVSDPRIGKAIAEVFVKSTDYLTREIDLSFRKAALSVKQAAIGGLTGQGLPGIAAAQMKMDLEGVNLQREANKTLEEIAKLNAMSLAIQTQEQVSKMNENMRSGELGGADKAFKDIADLFTKTIISGKGQESLIKQIRGALPGATPQQTTPLLAMFQSLTGMRALSAKRAETDAQAQIVTQKGISNIISDIFEFQARGLVISRQELDVQTQRLSSKEQEVGYLSDIESLDKKRLLDAKAQTDFELKRIEAEKEYAILSYDAARSGTLNEQLKTELKIRFEKKLQVAEGERLNALQQNELGLVNDNLKRQQVLTQEKQRQIDLEQRLLDIKLEIAALSLDQELKAMKDSLEYDKETATLSRQQLRDREALIRSKEAEVSYTKELARINQDYQSKARSLVNQYEGTRTDTEEGRKTRAGLLEEIALLAQRKTVLLDGVEQSKIAQEQLNAELARYTDQQIEYGKIFENTFDKMADAMVEFARTGKLSFSDLISSMLAELLRYELKLQTMQMYQNFRPGIMNMIGSFFGASGVASGFTGSSAGFGMPGGVFPSAKGNVFGIEKFAKGEMFTNSIVNTPTLFKFAKGTGLMGEAGPEAIMPLKRDSKGNLGVTAGSGPSVEVVVNNYSNARAEARETVDSRGNRRIEVVVGEMTAGEVTRGGSPTNKAIRGTFGLQPQLIRR